MHDVVIRGGTIVDGTGKPAFTGDVALAAGRVAAVGEDLGSAKKTIDADGLLVTPAWVDIHTHYDGQVAWDEQMTPSLWHGVSTVVMGNCGVGFAPATPDRHDWLIGLMEGVEDIPGPSLRAGLPWGWQSFSEYLDVLDNMPRTLDVGGMITHGAVRAFVMGERGAKNESATEKDIARMATIVKEAVLAGALGFSTSRTLAHTANDGEPVPGTFAREEELIGMAKAVRSTGRGILEVVPRGAGGENAELLQEVVKRRLFIERAAEADLLETAAYIREKRPASAPQFVPAAREAFDLLAEQPGIGRPYQTEHLRLQGLRVWQVKGFEKYLIFYRAGKQTGYVERVLYGGRNLDWILGGED